MIRHFKKTWQPLIAKARPAKLGPHQLVTLASIIEKEAQLDEERALISSVYHNRLRRGMLLQADPTVIYGLKNFDGNLTRAPPGQSHPLQHLCAQGPAARPHLFARGQEPGRGR